MERIATKYILLFPLNDLDPCLATLSFDPSDNPYSAPTRVMIDHTADIALHHRLRQRRVRAGVKGLRL